VLDALQRVGQHPWNVRTKRSPAFSVTRREPAFAAIVVATTRSTPSSVNPFSTSATAPSVASPHPPAAVCSR